MKKILIGFLSVAMLAFLVSCEDDTTAGISRLTYFPEFTIDAPASQIVAAGSSFSVPVGVAEEDGVALDVTVSVSSEINGLSELNTDIPDIYTISYSAVNSDGFPGSSSIEVLVAPPTGDFITSIEGLYVSSVDRVFAGSPGSRGPMSYIFVTKNSNGDYVISDYIGGWYYIGSQYGYDYAATGPTITVNNIATSDVTINGNDFGVGAFGDDAVITAMQFDPAAKTISYFTEWTLSDGRFVTFDVLLTQVQI